MQSQQCRTLKKQNQQVCTEIVSESCLSLSLSLTYTHRMAAAANADPNPDAEHVTPSNREESRTLWNDGLKEWTSSRAKTPFKSCDEYKAIVAAVRKHENGGIRILLTKSNQVYKLQMLSCETSNANSIGVSGISESK